MWEHAIAAAQQAGVREKAAIFQSAQAVCEAHFGNSAAAKEARPGRARSRKGRDVEYAAAFALALSGDSAGSQKLAADLAKRFPEDTPVQFEYLPTLHALSALAHGRRWTRSSDCNGRCLMISRCRARHSSQSSEACYPRMCAVRRIWQQGVARKPRRNFKKSSIIAASFLPIRSAPWRICNWEGHYVVSGDNDQGEKRLPGFPHALEGCRPGHPRPQTGQRRIREAVAIPQFLPQRRLDSSRSTALTNAHERVVADSYTGQKRRSRRSPVPYFTATSGS